MIRNVALVGILVLTLAACAQPTSNDLGYKIRGNRSEGILQPLKSGNDIELLSATVDYQEPAESIPSTLAIRFYLDSPAPASISVRGVRVAEDYWMNNVIPEKQWEHGFRNEFRWPTSEVIQKLSVINNMYDLGVVICLGAACDRTTTLVETVAPAIFYHSRLPDQITSYKFIFKPITHEALTFTLYSEVDGRASGSALASLVYPDVDPGVPFNVTFDAPTIEGWYQLQVNGIKRLSRNPVDKTIRFYRSRAPRP